MSASAGAQHDPSFWAQLPGELLSEVTLYLPPATCKKLEAVCHSWRHHLQQDYQTWHTVEVCTCTAFGSLFQPPHQFNPLRRSTQSEVLNKISHFGRWLAKHRDAVGKITIQSKKCNLQSCTADRFGTGCKDCTTLASFTQDLLRSVSTSLHTDAELQLHVLGLETQLQMFSGEIFRSLRHNLTELYMSKTVTFIEDHQFNALCELTSLQALVVDASSCYAGVSSITDQVSQLAKLRLLHIESEHEGGMSVAPGLSRLTALTCLSLHSHTRDCLGLACTLPALKKLNLTGHGLEMHVADNLPPSGMTCLCLKQYVMSGNFFRLTALSSLRYLALHRTDAHDDSSRSSFCHAIGMLTGLTALHIDSLTDMDNIEMDALGLQSNAANVQAALSSLTGLVTLTLASEISSFSAPANLKSLKELCLTWCGLTRLPRGLSSLSALETLELGSQCGMGFQLEADELDFAHRMDKLTYIDLRQQEGWSEQSERVAAEAVKIISFTGKRLTILY